MSSNSKIVFAADLSQMIKDRPVAEEEDHIEALVKLGEGIALNIRAVYVERDDAVVPNVWIHRILPEGETDPKTGGPTTALCFYPLVENKWSKSYGGHNKSWFMTTFGEVWKPLQEQMRERLRGDGSTSAKSEGPGSVKSPF